jgi:hypothetical protein
VIRVTGKRPARRDERNTVAGMTTDPADAAAAASAPPTDASDAPVWTLPRLGTALIVALLAQTLIGVANAIWLTVPDSGNAWSASSPGWLVNLHVGVGVVLLVLAVWILVLAGWERDRAWTAAGLVGILGIGVALAGGVVFMTANGNDVASFAMAAGCVVPIAGYTVALAQRRPD